MRLEELWRTVEQIPHAILKLEFAASGHHAEHFLWHHAAERKDVEQRTRKDTLSISGREARSCMCGGRRAAARRLTRCEQSSVRASPWCWAALAASEASRALSIGARGNRVARSASDIHSIIVKTRCHSQLGVGRFRGCRGAHTQSHDPPGHAQQPPAGSISY